MRIAATALVALAVSPAAAETAVSTNAACEVRFVRAPDDVRHEIERWLSAEPRCTSSIDLRVIPTDDGYYLLAQRPDGRIHERVVPNPQSAGVLVASWVADDWVVPPSPPLALAPRPIIVNPFADEPTRAITARAPVASRFNPRSLTLAAMIHAGGEGGGGLRMELDLIRRGAWTFGGALTASTAGHKLNEVTSYATEDYKATAFIARTSKLGNWQLRFAAGAGVLATESQMTSYTYTGTDTAVGFRGTQDVTLVGEASFTASRRISQSWALTGGPIVSAMSQQLVFYNPSNWDPEIVAGGRSVELMFAGGLRYAL